MLATTGALVAEPREVGLQADRPGALELGGAVRRGQLPLGRFGARGPPDLGPKLSRTGSGDLHAHPQDVAGLVGQLRHRRRGDRGLGVVHHLGHDQLDRSRQDPGLHPVLGVADPPSRDRCVRSTSGGGLVEGDIDAQVDIGGRYVVEVDPRANRRCGHLDLAHAVADREVAGTPDGRPAAAPVRGAESGRLAAIELVRRDGLRRCGDRHLLGRRIGLTVVVGDGQLDRVRARLDVGVGLLRLVAGAGVPEVPGVGDDVAVAVGGVGAAHGRPPNRKSTRR